MRHVLAKFARDESAASRREIGLIIGLIALIVFAGAVAFDQMLVAIFGNVIEILRDIM